MPPKPAPAKAPPAKPVAKPAPSKAPVKEAPVKAAPAPAKAAPPVKPVEPVAVSQEAIKASTKPPQAVSSKGLKLLGQAEEEFARTVAELESLRLLAASSGGSTDARLKAYADEIAELRRAKLDLEAKNDDARDELNKVKPTRSSKSGTTASTQTDAQVSNAEVVEALMQKTEETRKLKAEVAQVRRDNAALYVALKEKQLIAAPEGVAMPMPLDVKSSVGGKQNVDFERVMKSLSM